MVIIIPAGKRSIYSPAHYKIKKLLGDQKLVIVDMLFTWELQKAKDIQNAQKFFRPNYKVIIDGVGWVNLGNKSFLSWKEIEQMEDDCQPEEFDYQVTKVSVGCPKNCPYCFSKEFRFLSVPKINRNLVRLTDENLLALKNVEDLLNVLGTMSWQGKVINYELMAGIDKEFLTSKIAKALKKNRFKVIKFAWDSTYGLEFDLVENTLNMLEGSGYRLKDTHVFMICNWKVSFDENVKKVKYLYQKGVQVSDCWFKEKDHWSESERKLFRHICRRVGQLVRADCKCLETFIRNGGDAGRRCKLDPEFKRLMEDI